MDKVKLGDIAELKTGPFGTQFSASEYVSDGIPMINVKDIGYGEIYEDALERVSDSTKERLAQHVVNEGDIVFGRKGSIDRHAYIGAEQDGWVQGSDCIRVRADSAVNPRWLSHYFKLGYVRNQVLNGGVGSTMPSLNTDILKNIDVLLPLRFIQDSVESVLSCIDDKIANNKKLMTELEKTARLIYDYWFTQFDFPDENGRPYRSSGGKMVWSDELKREIPADWKAGMLSAVCRYADETIAANALDAQTCISLDNMMPNYGGITASEYCPSEGSCKSYRIGDTLLGNIRPYFKKVFQASRDGGCSPDVLVIRPTNGGRCYVYDTIARDCFIDYVVAGAKGTKMPRGDKDHIMRFRMAIPPRGIIEQYEKLVIQIHEYRSHAAVEDFELRSLRDWLLPMLMNGQLSIE